LAAEAIAKGLIDGGLSAYMPYLVPSTEITNTFKVSMTPRETYTADGQQREKSREAALGISFRKEIIVCMKIRRLERLC
jgi:hypothetical protein